MIFFSKQPYDRSVLTRRISNNIELITFSYPNVILVMYYNLQNNTILFCNLPPVDNVLLADLPRIKQEFEVTYHTFHSSVYKFGGHPVISVARNTVFSNDLEVTIYVEAKNDIKKDLNSLLNANGMDCIFLQIDSNEQIKYSSNPNIFKVGEMFDLSFEGLSESINGYICYKRDSQHGFTNVLLVPKGSYNREFYTWGTSILIVTFIVLIIIGLTGIIFYKLIYKPLHIFESEMEEVGRGNMEAINYHTGIEEFDRIFGRFNIMKSKIQKLMRDIEAKEKQRRNLEIEKFYYQINPHFLMNALNSAQWMAVVNNQLDISKYISKLNYILSYSLGKTDQDTTLRTEIKMLKTYLDLQKMRYDFDAFINVAEGDYLDTCVPRLILQPLAENAIHHGLDQNGLLVIDVRLNNNTQMIDIVIQDNGKGLDSKTAQAICHADALENQSFGQGIGLRYVYLMLKSFYGNSASMLIESQPKKGTTVKLFLPVKEGEHDPCVDSRR